MLVPPLAKHKRKIRAVEGADALIDRKAGAAA
jgi:hypothetical protein